MPTPREVVSADPELRRLQQRGRILMLLLPAFVLGAYFWWGQPVGWVFGGAVIMTLGASTRLLMLLGRHVESVQKGEQPIPAQPSGPPVFGGLLGSIGLIFLVLAGAAAIASIVEFFGAKPLRDLGLLPPFLTLILAFFGFLAAGTGYSRAKKHFLSERGPGADCSDL